MMPIKPLAFLLLVSVLTWIPERRTLRLRGSRRVFCSAFLPVLRDPDQATKTFCLVTAIAEAGTRPF